MNVIELCLAYHILYVYRKSGWAASLLLTSGNESFILSVASPRRESMMILNPVRKYRSETLHELLATGIEHLLFITASVSLGVFLWKHLFHDLTITFLNSLGLILFILPFLGLIISGNGELQKIVDSWHKFSRKNLNRIILVVSTIFLIM